MLPIVIYGVLGFLAWNANGPVGAAIVIAFAGAVHYSITRPLKPDQRERDHASVEMPDARIRQFEHKQPTLGSKIGEVVGGAFRTSLVWGDRPERLVRSAFARQLLQRWFRTGVSLSMSQLGTESPMRRQRLLELV
jgi:hypothetical protein